MTTPNPPSPHTGEECEGFLHVKKEGNTCEHGSYNFGCGICFAAHEEVVRAEERARVYREVTSLHVKAKKAFASKTWDAGYHDALFDVERRLTALDTNEGV